jgi:hypothetical protein
MGSKPGDETIQGTPDFGPKKPDTKSGSHDKYIKPSDDKRALGEDLGGTTGTHKEIKGETAPEVSQGAWRERAFIPRATMSRDEMLHALGSLVDGAKGRVGSVAPVFELLRTEWLPVLRQAMEQAGGDGIDAWLLTVLKPPGRAATAPLLSDLIEAFGRMRKATAVDALLTHARSVVEAVDRATQKPKRVSFKQMERELEGKVEIHELLKILFSDDEELVSRLEEIGNTMETIRGQLKSMPGAKPDGMYSNFTRLKAEARVLSAELSRRGLASK